MGQSGARATNLRNEVFHDGLTTYWMLSEHRTADEAVKIAAQVNGPFFNWIKVELVAGTVKPTENDGYAFTPDADGDVECWEVDAE